MKKNIILGAAVLAATGIALLATSASAYRGNVDQTGPNYTPERHEQMEKAFADGDYAAWKDLMDGRGRVTEVVNEGNFNRFSEMHRLMEEGDTDGAAKIRAELGLGQRTGQNGGRGQGFVDKDRDGICDRLQ